MSRTLTVLVIGGYGVFGGRLVDLLSDETRLTLVVAGRSLGRARAFCARRQGAAAELTPARFDRDGDVRAQIAALKPNIVVDASGPFQAYGDKPYRVAEAAISERADYLDLADAPALVVGIAALDGHARAARLYALSGASTFPALTVAVARRVGADMARFDAIRAGIAPSPRARRGGSVVKAMAAQAGQPVHARHGGRSATAFAFTEGLSAAIAPPGLVPLRRRLFALIDAPDLSALPALWPKTAWVGAGPAPGWLLRLLMGCAWLVRWKTLRSLSAFAPLMQAAAALFGWGEHRSGMFVAIDGARRDGLAVSRSFHLIAEGDDGPFIRAMAAEALVRRALDGRVPAPGARSAAGEIDFGDYERAFAKRAIRWGVRAPNEDEAGSLYARALGPAWRELPKEIRAMHGFGAGGLVSEGRAIVARGAHPLSRMLGFMFGFPQQGAEVPLTVRMSLSRGGETWTRQFAETRMVSRQYAGRGSDEHLLCERFGALEFAMAVVVADGKLTLVLRRWKALGLALPLFLGPRVRAFEQVFNGRFHFSVEISHPLCGLMVRYQGWLKPQTAETPATAAATPWAINRCRGQCAAGRRRLCNARHAARDASGRMFGTHGVVGAHRRRLTRAGRRAPARLPRCAGRSAARSPARPCCPVRGGYRASSRALPGFCPTPALRSSPDRCGGRSRAGWPGWRDRGGRNGCPARAFGASRECGHPW
jgi:hypothetical protein